MTDETRENFLPTASIENLTRRSHLLQRVREFFLERDFLEVDTPVLSRDTVVDCYIDPISVTLGNSAEKFWLQTSPEFAMKRLLAAGMESIFQITRAFRDSERGDLHNPEFTIVEWYMVGQSYSDGQQMLGELLAHSLDDVDSFSRVSYEAAFRETLNINPHTCSVDELKNAASNHNVVPPSSMNTNDRDEWLNLLLAECVEHTLGIDQPTIMYDYPASQAALACVDNSGEAPVAQRFEAYYKGMELANGYFELCDAEEHQHRNDSNNKKRRADSRSELPTQSYLLSAMSHGLPQSTGVALGFDRLVMLAANSSLIDDVIPFPIERA
ncbi:MAG: EF-P lysine aminoacylase GenX [Planctomycetales bacterium]|nr:EF-P lysine aminoacylase GenX [Planctomycetales bacterium]